MATPRWIGGASNVAQVETWTLGGTWETDDLIVVTIGSRRYTFTAGSTSITTITASLTTAWNALSTTLYPEFAELTMANPTSTTVSLTADTAGKPFTITVSTTEAGGGAADAQTLTPAATTANSGKWNWDTALNWSTGAIPADTDTVRIDSGGDILYGFAQSAIEPAAVIIAKTYTGKIGLGPINRDNTSATYPEYRDQYLVIGPVLLTIGEGTGSGSPRIRIDTGTDPCVCRVLGTGQPEETGVGAVQLKGSEATNELHVQSGYVSSCQYLGETADYASVSSGPEATVYLGAGVTLSDAAILQNGGSLTINSATTGTSTIVQNGGRLTINDGGHVSLTVRGGDCIYNSTGTLGGNPRVSGNGHLDFSHDPRAKVVTNPVEVYGENAKLSDPYKRVGSLVVDLNETESTANVKIGRDVRLTRGTPA